MAANSSDPEIVMVSKQTSEECDLAIKSAKMHLRILQAQITFLEETKSRTPELQDMLSSLVPTPKSPSGLVVPPAAPPEQAVAPPAKKLVSEPYIFPTPQKYSANCNSLGRSVRDVVAKTGDEIIVCGVDNDFAMAFNPRNKTAGRIPLRCLQKGKSKTTVTSSLHLAQKNHTTIMKGTDGCGVLPWSVGDYIRVYQWYNPQTRSIYRGIAVNMAKKQIGRFISNGYEFTLMEEDV